jgi:hypothetical protein
MDETSHTYCVPVRAVDDAATLVVKTGRLPRGQRVGIAFTAPDRLAAAMGHDQRWITLSASALRAMLAPLGVTGIQVDPILVAPALWEPSTRRSSAATHEAWALGVLVGAGVHHA